jgi:hypothetical protein
MTGREGEKPQEGRQARESQANLPAHQASGWRYEQDSELSRGKPMRGRVLLELFLEPAPWCRMGETPGEAEAQESNVLYLALNKRGRVTALRSAKSLEAGPR